ncbi:hypothetical protein CKAN_00995400 [Cinnamomum micranthum f. kanehirae]|uniref:Uncharacterized protein n=1 Tax=Cinnamomum micranthum f. kanehirae TaxID=337451 RepID=A0A3S3MCW8_9MAGN|nr:hypothetical protein CKAN_00995400 [Cinnamomum micranthum f. kanehirae]
MEANYTLRPWCSYFLPGLCLLFTITASMADAEIHYHDFVKLTIWLGTGSSKASEEAVQNPRHNHSEWGVPRSNFEANANSHGPYFELLCIQDIDDWEDDDDEQENGGTQTQLMW